MSVEQDVVRVLGRWAVGSLVVGAALSADPRTRDVGTLIADLYEPDFALASGAVLTDSVRRAREVIRGWS